MNDSDLIDTENYCLFGDPMQWLNEEFTSTQERYYKEVTAWPTFRPRWWFWALWLAIISSGLSIEGAFSFLRI